MTITTSEAAISIAWPNRGMRSPNMLAIKPPSRGPKICPANMLNSCRAEQAAPGFQHQPRRGGKWWRR